MSVFRLRTWSYHLNLDSGLVTRFSTTNVDVVRVLDGNARPGFGRGRCVLSRRKLKTIGWPSSQLLTPGLPQDHDGRLTKH